MGNRGENTRVRHADEERVRLVVHRGRGLCGAGLADPLGLENRLHRVVHPRGVLPCNDPLQREKAVAVEALLLRTRQRVVTNAELMQCFVEGHSKDPGSRVSISTTLRSAESPTNVAPTDAPEV